MSDSIVQNSQLIPIEHLLASLPGVVSARVAAGAGGHLEEIHILATSELHPKQIVRNIESALSAGLGIEINRRIVSVAQLRAGAVEEMLATAEPVREMDEDDLAETPGPFSAQAAPSPDQGALPAVLPATETVAPRLGATTAPGTTPTPPPAAMPADLSAATAAAPPVEQPAPGSSAAPGTTSRPAVPGRSRPRGGKAQRFVFLGHEVTVDASRTATCSVALRAGDAEFTGRGEGFDTPQGRAEAAARAVFDAFARSGETDRLGLEGVAIVEAPGRDCVLVAVRSLDGRRRRSLTGVAPLGESPEEAAILAVLQATNNWRTR
jgi:hypothetical protein